LEKRRSRVTKVLMVVAHYDDPVIWAGGAVRQTRSEGWDWTVVATCVEERSRREYFEAWCESLGVHPVSLLFKDHPDGGPFSQNHRTSLREAILGACRKTTFDWVFTHSLDKEGEYGPHPNHTEAAQTVVSLADERVLPAQSIAHFAYRRIYGLGDLPSVATRDASHYLPLDYEVLRWKAAWCARAQDVELLDSSLGGHTWLEKLAWPCPNPEAFVGDGLKLPPPFAGR
jgi:LmbE family N-acetylglucosaminyl deacetylase